ncbi:NIPSNAP-domain-containing protein [Polychytrium aggregatum]|uniref:NIPSNAP-domain-containing protein n=1 Tax=Polychytrium aggregatum TaxID=110093 RepID=UPI0022FEF45D|nr:NIPSNAP-domain-containing protein [Polychytrium aggregatum]KAI9202855.1 NIPSNAP-domain-containing protein [Polychytrium aggregatum]
MLSQFPEITATAFSDAAAGSVPPSPPPAKTTVAGKAQSIVKSILHGVSEDDSPFQEVQDTHSKLLARGKYVHELQIHDVKPEAWDDYLGLVGERYTKVAEDPAFKVKLFGSWTTEIGDLDQAVHVWEYNHYPGYTETKALLAQDLAHREFEKKLRPMLRQRKNQIMLEFAFWAGSPPAAHGGVYELRTYQLKPGRLLEWETEWRRGLEARRKHVQPIGAWFSQLGHLNYVHHMWVYPDLQTRKERREAAWQVEGWSQTVYKTVRLIDRMQGFILRANSFSPLK